MKKYFHIFLSIIIVLLINISYTLISYSQLADHVVISEIYGGGGNTGSTYKQDYVELYNPTENPIVMTDWSIQYAASTGNFSSTNRTMFSGTIPARGFFLIGQAKGTGGTTDLPTLDVSGSIAMSSSAGKIALARNNIIVAGPTSANVVDFVGYGSANQSESSPVSALSNTTSAERKAKQTSTATSMANGGLDHKLGNGWDSNNNSSDFVIQSIQEPQNSLFPPEPSFISGGNGTGIAKTEPAITYINQSIDSLNIYFKQDSNYVIETVLLIIPNQWTWSRSLTDIVLNGQGFTGASMSILGDTVIITSTSIGQGDSVSVVLKNLISPQTNGKSTFLLKTAVSSGVPVQILKQPEVRVLGLVPIVSVHVNDAQGVPAPPFQIGAEVTVSGIVTTNWSSTRTDFYVQDETAGINIFSFDPLPINIKVGDSVTVTGSIIQFRGLTEISPEFSLLWYHTSDRPIPEPLLLTCDEVNKTFQPDFSEPNESRLIRINGVTYNPTTSTITDHSGTTTIFIPSSYPPTPSMFDVIGILKQYKPGTPAPGPPFTSDYEIVPRTPEDIIPHPGPVIILNPSEDNITPTSVRISWKTSTQSTSIVRYGVSSIFTDSLVDLTPTIDHSVTVSNLEPANIYHYNVGSEDQNGYVNSPSFLFSSASPPQTTGKINVYFNRSVNTSVSIGELALGNQDLVARLLTRINNARRSVDVCIYSFSGTPGETIANALVSAKNNRGVKVRVIGEYDNMYDAGSGTLRYPWTIFASNQIPLISDRFDPINFGAGLMHNKFFVFDYRGGAPESVWVWTGSWNLTPNQTTTDHQNSIEIQDVALAGAYTTEFNEMWGSDTDIPNSGNSRFGVRKRDNTPHRFVIAGQPVECYFSPSDRTTTQIKNTLRRSAADVAFALFAFTRRDIVDTLIARRNAGRRVRGVMDSSAEPEQFNYLAANGVDVRLEPTSNLMHHKYAIVDGTRGSVEPTWVITGSHNWSSAATNSNNENIVIVQSTRIANLYLQEFAARYYEAGGADSIRVSVNEIGSGIPDNYSLSQNYPNPFNPTTTINFSIPKSGLVTLKVYNILGQEVASLVNEEMKAGNYRVNFNANGLASGVYFYKLQAPIKSGQAGSFNSVKKFTLLK